MQMLSVHFSESGLWLCTLVQCPRGHVALLESLGA